ncbi:hypothetical protein [Streptomyces sp. NPDC002692]
MSERCEFTELPVDSCAHCRGNTLTPDEEAAAELPDSSRPWFHAVYPGVCACCGTPFAAGTAIRLQAPRGWRADCCREDTS